MTISPHLTSLKNPYGYQGISIAGCELRTTNKEASVNKKKLDYDVHRLDGKIYRKAPIFPRQLQSPTRNHNPLRYVPSV